MKVLTILIVTLSFDNFFCLNHQLWMVLLEIHYQQTDLVILLFHKGFEFRVEGLNSFLVELLSSLDFL